jgi:hypothetical protein
MNVKNRMAQFFKMVFTHYVIRQGTRIRT